MAIMAYENKTFKFSGKLTIYKVSELKNKLLEGYNSEASKEGDFFLDLSGVESIDAAVLQLLIALKNLVKNGKGNLKLKESSQTFDSLLELFGIPVDTFPKAA
jgi:anti-anti-sigma factor